MKHTDVLIIDDEKKFAAMLAKRLELRSCSCDICYDGGTALKWVEKNKDCLPLILLDLQLPDLYGTQVLAGIKSIDPSAPVVVITGHGTDKDKQVCKQMGACHFLNKPVSIEKILDILKMVKEKKAQ